MSLPVAVDRSARPSRTRKNSFPGTMCGTGEAEEVWSRSASADDLLEGVAERVSLVRGQLDDESTAAFERNAHDDAPPLLGHLERAIARPRLHGRHARSPSCNLLIDVPPVRPPPVSN